MVYGKRHKEILLIFFVIITYWIWRKQKQQQQKQYKQYRYSRLTFETILEFFNCRPNKIQFSAFCLLTSFFLSSNVYAIWCIGFWIIRLFACSFNDRNINAQLLFRLEWNCAFDFLCDLCNCLFDGILNCL